MRSILGARPTLLLAKTLFRRCDPFTVVKVLGPAQLLLASRFSPPGGFLPLICRYATGSSPWHAGCIVDVPLARSTEALTAWRTHSLSNGCVGLVGTSGGAEHALPLTAWTASDGTLGLPNVVAGHAAPDVVRGVLVQRASGTHTIRTGCPEIQSRQHGLGEGRQRPCCPRCRS